MKTQPQKENELTIDNFHCLLIGKHIVNFIHISVQTKFKIIIIKNKYKNEIKNIKYEKRTIVTDIYIKDIKTA